MSPFRATRSRVRGVATLVPLAVVLLALGCVTGPISEHATEIDPSFTPPGREVSQRTEFEASALTQPRRPDVVRASLETQDTPSAESNLPSAGKSQAKIQKIQYERTGPLVDVPLLGPGEPQRVPEEDDADADNRFPIDLSTALGLAGANNLQIALATERVNEAQARLDEAEVLWLPSLNAGVGYNNHAGRLQETEGGILEVSRESLFVGGGPVVSGIPLAGGSSGPVRMGVDLSLADAIFEPLSARQLASAADANRARTFNDTLLEVALVYLELVRAQGRLAIARETEQNAGELAMLTKSFEDGGRGLKADTARASGELANRRRLVEQAREMVQVVSTELARLLRLDPTTTLFPLEDHPVPLNLIDEGNSLPALIAQAGANRPEIEEQDSLVGAAYERMRQERWRPWLPNVHLGFSSGGFGGGADGFFGDFSDRTDFDAIAVWELRNLGFGTRAVQRQRESEHLQAHLMEEQTRDRIAAEVARAYHQVKHRRGQIEAARAEVEAAAEALPLNFNGIRGGTLRAIEAQQAIAALASGRDRYLSSVVDHNQAQFQLLRALGQPPAEPLAATETANSPVALEP